MPDLLVAVVADPALAAIRALEDVVAGIRTGEMQGKPGVAGFVAGAFGATRAGRGSRVECVHAPSSRRDATRRARGPLPFALGPGRRNQGRRANVWHSCP